MKKERDHGYVTWQGYGIKFPSEDWQAVAKRMWARPELPNPKSGTFDISSLPIFDPTSIESLEREIPNLEALKLLKRYCGGEEATQFKLEIRMIPSEETHLTKISTHTKGKRVFYSTGRTKKELISTLTKYSPGKPGKVKELLDLPNNIDDNEYWRNINSVEGLDGILILDSYQDAMFVQPKVTRTVYLPRRNKIFYLSYLGETPLSRARVTYASLLGYKEERTIITNVFEENPSKALILEELLGFEVRNKK